ncbi:MAG: ferritin-like domain-containing protein [Polyangiales bacterium]
MSTRKRLQQVFALALLSAAGCSGSVSNTLEGEDSLDLDVCQGDKWLAVHGLSPAHVVDYVSLRQSFGGGPGGSPDPILDEDGTVCATATDKAKCVASMSSLHSSAGWSSGSGGDVFALSYLAVTVKDDQIVYGSVSDLVKFLGPIDTANEAALIATTKGHQILCQTHNAKKTADGYQVLTRTGTGCGQGDDVRKNLVLVKPDGSSTVVSSVVTKTGDPNCAIGRRPEGLARLRARRDGAGDFLARIARLEAASVPAFGRFVRELRAHRAPRALVARAVRARRDEVRHARVMTRLAEKYGASVPSAEIGALPVRALEAVALDNAIEGCVRETYGALVASFQAQHASDPEIAAAMRTIARDETAHAALSWDFAKWATARLDEESRARVEAARTRALGELEAELETEPPAEAVSIAGFPTRAQAKALFTALASSFGQWV